MKFLRSTNFWAGCSIGVIVGILATEVGKRVGPLSHDTGYLAGVSITIFCFMIVILYLTNSKEVQKATVTP